LPRIGRGEMRCDVKSGRSVNADGVCGKKDRLQAARETRPGSMPIGGTLGVQSAAKTQGPAPKTYSHAEECVWEVLGCRAR
jgi:hypothetical protein